jgi:hypothetical protein
VGELLSCYEKLDCNISLKIHFLQGHLGLFPENCGAVSDEYGERFHQDIAAMKKRHGGKWSPAYFSILLLDCHQECPKVSLQTKS